MQIQVGVKPRRRVPHGHAYKGGWRQAFGTCAPNNNNGNSSHRIGIHHRLEKHTLLCRMLHINVALPHMVAAAAADVCDVAFRQIESLPPAHHQHHQPHLHQHQQHHMRTAPTHPQVRPPPQRISPGGVKCSI